MQRQGLRLAVPGDGARREGVYSSEPACRMLNCLAQVRLRTTIKPTSFFSAGFHNPVPRTKTHQEVESLKEGASGELHRHTAPARRLALINSPSSSILTGSNGVVSRLMYPDPCFTRRAVPPCSLAACGDEQPLEEASGAEASLALCPSGDVAVVSPATSRSVSALLTEQSTGREVARRNPAATKPTAARHEPISRGDGRGIDRSPWLDGRDRAAPTVSPIPEWHVCARRSFPNHGQKGSSCWTFSKLP
ncbi:hypothetical protein P7K49_014931 [Saguinus oedipus]|uniref:Uncharacterized protein n=1 Tax=Saguinus oedipus TaxID=9490 RepID=A0ABQ9V855_SAGOE|nr:hypothetical protein P7K49_014931 [Saguinus oedipus]